MCLTRVTKKLREPKMVQFYKVMWRIRRPGNRNIYQFPHRSACEPLVKGKIRHASNEFIVVGAYSIYASARDVGLRWRYKSGFHGYTNLRQAAKVLRYRSSLRRWDYKSTARGNAHKVVVLCEGLVHTYGSQQSGRVCVAKTMKILREIPLTHLFPKKK